jgi:hypothetical protein
VWVNRASFTGFRQAPASLLLTKDLHLTVHHHVPIAHFMCLRSLSALRFLFNPMTEKYVPVDQLVRGENVGHYCLGKAPVGDSFEITACSP